MDIPQAWHANAFNTSPESDNQIHSDEMAHRYGFKGGLVPGVAVSAYLMHPAVEAWGLAWLSRGHAKVVVLEPTYDGDDFTVALEGQGENSYSAYVVNPAGIHAASATIELPQALPEPPTMRGDPLLPNNFTPQTADLALMQKLREGGMFSMPARWDERNEMASYLKRSQHMPALHRLDQEGYANGAFMLGLTNWVLAGNVYMNPWIHLQTESQYFAPVQRDTRVRVECDIADLFNKRGHEFVDLNVDVYEEKTAQPLMRAQLRAIYQLRTQDA